LAKKKNLLDREEARRTRANLAKLVHVAETVLEKFFNQLRNRQLAGSIAYERLLRSLDRIRTLAFERATSLRKSLAIGLNEDRREALDRYGMFGDELAAKLQFLLDCVRDSSASVILKTLNSMLGSLGQVFGAAEVLKEFKELMEAFLEHLGPGGDPITLNISNPPPIST
jgi:hypothetical protein